MITTPGRIILDGLVPDDMRDDLDTPLNKKGATAFFRRLAQRHPDKYVDVMKRMVDQAGEVSAEYGRWTSVSLKDMELPPRTKAFRDMLVAGVDRIAQDPRLSPEAKSEKIVTLLQSQTDKAKSLLEEEGAEVENALALSSKNGVRGNPTQLMQMLIGDVLVSDNDGKTIPVPLLHGYVDGLTPLETWAGSYGSRAGYMSVQFATADTGYFAKQMAHMNTGMQVLADDCGTTEGLPIDPRSEDAAGRKLARAAGKLKAGTSLTPETVRKLQAKEVMVRSPLTCRLPHGVCQTCAGLRPDGSLPKLNSFVSLEASRVTSEPMTQKLALAAKHSGGQGGKDTRMISGFDEVDQFVQVPDTFKGAVLSEIDGMVRDVKEAPQGGYYVDVDDEQYYVPRGLDVTVKKGARLQAGDPLTGGTMNPADVARFRGIGEGRRYFVDTYGEILKRNGVPAQRNNLELLARSYIQNVRVTDPEGVAGYRFGEILPYESLQARWVPRGGAQKQKLQYVANQYLEEPVAHYTIGTRLTPSILKDMETHGVKEVTSHKDPPGFQPQITRAAARSLDEQDWKARLGGFYLKTALQDMASLGAVDEPEGRPSAFAAIMDPSKLKEVK